MKGRYYYPYYNNICMGDKSHCRVTMKWNPLQCAIWVTDDRPSVLGSMQIKHSKQCTCTLLAVNNVCRALSPDWFLPFHLSYRRLIKRPTICKLISARRKQFSLGLGTILATQCKHASFVKGSEVHPSLGSCLASLLWQSQAHTTFN